MSGTRFWSAAGAVVVATLFARWIWFWFAPQAPEVMPATATVSVEIAENLFGVSSAASANVPALPNVSLVGVFSGRHGFAVLMIDGNRQVGVPVGGEIVPGAKLLEAAMDHVIVEQGGMKQRIDLKGLAAKP